MSILFIILFIYLVVKYGSFNSNKLAQDTAKTIASTAGFYTGVVEGVRSGIKEAKEELRKGE